MSWYCSSMNDLFKSLQVFTDFLATVHNYGVFRKVFRAGLAAEEGSLHTAMHVRVGLVCR